MRASCAKDHYSTKYYFQYSNALKLLLPLLDYRHPKCRYFWASNRITMCILRVFEKLSLLLATPFAKLTETSEDVHESFDVTLFSIQSIP
jgi:hypothetical protein